MAAVAGTQVTKKAARTAARAALRAVPPEVLAEESAALAGHLLAAPAFGRAKTIGLYIHCAKLREVETGALLAAASAIRDGKNKRQANEGAPTRAENER